MADNKGFHVVKPEENIEKKGDLKSQIVRHRLAVAIRAMIAIAVVVVLFIIFRNQYRNQIYTVMNVTDRTEKIRLI